MLCLLKLEFHGTDTDTDTDVRDAPIVYNFVNVYTIAYRVQYTRASLTDILATILARKSSRMLVSVSVPWNSSLIQVIVCRCLEHELVV